MMPSGEGQLQQQFEKLKQQLLSEGLFDKDSKKPIPKYLDHVGIITAVDSAAMTDFVNIMQDQVPFVKITVIPAIVQGLQSPASLLNALQKSTQLDIDALVLLRGGGSAEDLASFNDEQLIRSVFSHPIPVISAIGHDVDFTLLDFVADHRAATPTDAAVYLASPFNQFMQSMEHVKNQLHHTLDLKTKHFFSKLIRY